MVRREMGPGTGKAEVLISRRHTTPLFAAMVNAASSHFAEQDDLHNGSVFHPGTVVFPPAVAVAQALGSSGRDLLTAAVAGYEVGIRVGEFLGRSHYRVFHTTGTAGTIAAAVAVGHLLGLSTDQMLRCVWLLLALRRRGYGNSCVTAPTQSSCTQRRLRPMVFLRRTSRRKGSLARSTFWKVPKAWRLACLRMPIHAS